MSADPRGYTVRPGYKPGTRTIIPNSPPTASVSVAIQAHLVIDHDMVERACRAHWPSFDRMRRDHAAAWRVKMQAALAAALYGGGLRP